MSGCNAPMSTAPCSPRRRLNAWAHDASVRILSMMNSMAAVIGCGLLGTFTLHLLATLKEEQRLACLGVDIDYERIPRMTW